MFRPHLIVALASLGVALATNARAAPTMGIEWEFLGRTGVVGVTRGTNGSIMLTDAQSSSAARILCLDPASDGGYPRLSFTYDMGRESEGHVRRTLEVVSGALPSDDLDAWKRTLGDMKSFFEAVRSACKPTHYMFTDTDSVEHEGDFCYASANEVRAKMPTLSSEAQCNKSPRDRGEVGFYLDLDDEGAASKLDVAFYATAVPQVNLGIALTDWGNRDLSELFQADEIKSAYVRAQKVLPSSMDPRVRGFFILYAFALNGATRAAIHKVQDPERDEAERKNLFDLYLKTKLGEVYQSVESAVQAAPFVISTDARQMSAINEALCVIRTTTDEEGLCLKYRALGASSEVNVLRDWNQAILAHDDPIGLAKALPLLDDRVVVEVRDGSHALNTATRLLMIGTDLTFLDASGETLAGMLRGLR